MQKLKIYFVIILAFVPHWLAAQDKLFTPDFSRSLLIALNDQRNTYNIYSISASFYVSEQCKWAVADGIKYPDATTRATSDLLYSFGSITKTFVATLILQLVEEGKLNLNDPLSRWLDTYSNIDSAITVRQLLNHTSGIYNYTSHPSVDSEVHANIDYNWSPDEILNTFVLQPEFIAGSSWGYSNTNYILLEQIIQAVTGNTIDEELANRITKPLQLNATFLEMGDPDPDRWASTAGVIRSLYTLAGSAGSIASTATEIARWGQILYSGQFLQDSTLDSMLTFDYEGFAQGYGLGVQRYSVGRGLFFPTVTSYGHDGGIGRFVSHMSYMPEYNITLAFSVSFSVDAIRAPTYIHAVRDALVRAYRDHPDRPADNSFCGEALSEQTQLVIVDPDDAGFTGYARDHFTNVESNSFDVSDSIDIGASITVATADVGETGKLYVIALYEGNYYLKTLDGSFVLWGGDLDDLQPALTTTALGAVESIEIISQLSGFEGEFLFYTAYSNAEGELRYSLEPIAVTVRKQ